LYCFVVDVSCAVTITATVVVPPSVSEIDPEATPDATPAPCTVIEAPKWARVGVAVMLLTELSTTAV
jgi:hypothetical protein